MACQWCVYGSNFLKIPLHEIHNKLPCYVSWFIINGRAEDYLHAKFLSVSAKWHWVYGNHLINLKLYLLTSCIYYWSEGLLVFLRCPFSWTYFCCPWQAVADIVRTTLGPRSMLKMLLDASGGRILIILL